MTATAIETGVLESLDFEIVCQVVYTYMNVYGQKIGEEPACSNPATHSATIHQAFNCALTDKFICEGCIPRFHDECLHCAETNRISNIVPLPKAS